MVVLIIAILLLILGLFAATAFIIYSRFGRDVSIPFSVLMIIIASISLGISTHLFLIWVGI
ncbi:MAG: hypothetical protein GY870_22580 [archaeon]|nr:hypothetical protein [archaeon]